LTTKQIGQAMLNVSRNGYPKQILESKDIHAAAMSLHHSYPARFKTAS
jgi:hypothetical protein